MASAAELGEARAKQVRAITLDRAKDVLKERQREKKLVDKWSKEYITIRLLTEDGEELDGCTWQIQRAKLTPQFLQGRMDQSPLKNVKIDCIKDPKTEEIIYPDEMQKKCIAKTIYQLIPRWPRYPEDCSKDPRYQGDYGLTLFEVPLRDEAERHEVTEKDVREWLIFAILEEDRKGRRLSARIAEIEEEMKETAKTMAQIPHMDLSDFSGDEQDRERERLYRQFEDVRNLQGEDLDLAKKRLAFHREVRKDVKLDVVRFHADHEAGVAHWAIRFLDSADGPTILTDLLAKFDWGGIRLALGHKDFPPWAGRGDVPSGSKKMDKTDYSRYSVNMRGVKLSRMWHGFGTFKSTSEKGTAVSGDRFEFHHGTFQSGKRHGYGLSYTDEGLFFGTYHEDVRLGQGRLDTAYGDAIEGSFGYALAHKPSKLRPNPFLRGVPYGAQMRVSFADGSLYEGEMNDGRITGKGKYVSALGEVMEGEFKDGKLEGQGRFESAFDETSEGKWKHGLLHGNGKWVGSHKESYTGNFHKGLKHGKGLERYSNGNFYRGFYRENYRHGRGSMFYGHVKDEIASDGVHVLKFDCRMDCLWLAGYMRAGGLNHYAKSGNAFFTFPRKSVWYPFVSRLKDNEERWQSENDKLRRRQYFMYEMVRKEIENTKVKAFVQSRDTGARLVAKEAKGGDRGRGLRGADVEAVFKARRGQLEYAARRGRINPDDEDLNNLKLPEHTARLEEVAEEQKFESTNSTQLAQILQLVFEGVEERFKIYSTAATLKEFMNKAEKKADEYNM